MRVVFVHGACVRDGAWWWGPTAELLAARGVHSDAALLPSCGESGESPGHEGPGLADDVAAVREVLAESDEPTVVVAHSYGGIVVAEAAAGLRTIKHMVFVSSYLADVGESLSTFGEDEPGAFLDIDPDSGTFTVRPEMMAEVFLQDCSHEIQAIAQSKTARQSLLVLGQPVQSASWKEAPSTYVVCADDRGTPARLQRQYATKADRVVELGTGHHPFVSQPSAFAELILELQQ